MLVPVHISRHKPIVGTAGPMHSSSFYPARHNPDWRQSRAIPLDQTDVAVLVVCNEKLLMPIAINVGSNDHIGGATGPMHTVPVDPAAADPDRHQGRAIPLEQTDVAVLVVCN